MMSFDLPQIPVQETGIVVLAQAATKKRLENEPGPFDLHVYLKPPTAQHIEKQHALLAGTLVSEEFSSGAASAGTIDETVSNNREMLMMDFYVPADLSVTPAVVVAQAGLAKPKVLKPFTICQDIGSDMPDSAWNRFSIFGYGELKDAAQITNHKVRLLQAPSHGIVTLNDDAKTPVGEAPVNFKWSTLVYLPTQDYVGKDRAVFLVEANGKQYQVTVNFWVMPFVTDENEGDTYCKLQKFGLSDSDSQGVAAWPASIALSTFLTAAYGVAYSFSNLTGAAIGNTVGEGVNATITLDTDAAGHGWFIDATPTDNAEFLPTSNPNEWIAKEGSEAYGKMDLLTVLLHEYGHALGLEHSTDAHDFMATTLQPGVRRTLTVDEQLALMQLAGYFPTPDSPSAPYGPTDPGAPLPFTRVLSNARNARLRREEGLDALVPQFDTAANPKLTNPEFAGAQGWATTGDVAFTNGTATLTETASTQTRLNQVFVLGENDRFLSFTLDNTALGDQANGPDDAFEVALIDASSGLSLMGGTGLTHNDAIVNRQADGSEYKATGINVVNNADGSRTYLVDLAGVNKNGAAGTVVNLAFDLIGFGSGAAATNSHLTIRDLRLGVPQTTDDTATLAEDSPVIIDALANDLNARQPGFVPVVVSGPVHGQVAIDAEGRFTYTPEANWNGTDSFTYKISDSHVDSNLATVTLTVTPVKIHEK